MAELLTATLMVELLDKLATAFPSRQNTGEMAKKATVYRDALTGLSGDAVRHAVKRAIQEDQFFPKVARLRELARQWTDFDHRAGNPGLVVAPDPLHCPSCRTTAVWLRRWRPRFAAGADGGDTRDTRAWALSADGGWLLLEPYERLLCACAAPCSFTPADDVEPPALRVTEGMLPRHQGVRACAIVVTVAGVPVAVRTALATVAA